MSNYHELDFAPLPKPATPPRFRIGDRVRPAFDGEDSRGLLRWSRLTGTVRDVWAENEREWRCEVRWDQRAPYATRLEEHFLAPLASRK